MFSHRKYKDFFLQQDCKNRPSNIKGIKVERSNPMPTAI